MENELEEWKAAHANLETEKNNHINEMQSTFSNMANEIKDLKETNSQLEEYIKCLEKEEGFAYRGKRISDTKKKQLTLKAFLSRAQTALLFSKAFGLELELLMVKETNTGNPMKLILKEKQTNLGKIQLLRLAVMLTRQTLKRFFTSLINFEWVLNFIMSWARLKMVFLDRIP